MSRIRVLVAEMPRMLSDIVSSLVAKQQDMELVGEPVRGKQVVRAVRRLRPHVVVLASHGSELTALGHRLLEVSPRLKLVAVTENGRLAHRYELRPQQTPISEVSPQGLLEAVRAAVAED